MDVNEQVDQFIKDVCGSLVDTTKEDYHNDLETFEQYKARKTEIASTYIKEYGTSVFNGYNLILEKLKTMRVLEDV